MESTLLARLISLFAPWNTLYSDSKVIADIVTSLHLLALLFGGGLAIAADRATLQMSRRGNAERQALLENVRVTHKPVLIALTVSFLSGIALATADIETFAGSPVFWIKMTLVTLLLINGLILQRTESRLIQDSDASLGEHSWNRMRFTARASMMLWSAILIAGTVLVNS